MEKKIGEQNKLVQAIYKDCEILISNFVKRDNPDFCVFCEEYKLIKFQYLYHSHNSDIDMILTTWYIFHFCKKYFDKTNSNTVIHKAGAIYLMYCTYYKQPQKEYVKIELDILSYKSIRNFVDSTNQSLIQVRYIFYKLLKDNAFCFVYSDIKYGLENFLNKLKETGKQPGEMTDLNGDKFLSRDISTLMNKDKGLIQAIDVLQKKYNLTKTEINSQEDVEANRIPMTKFLEQYKAKFNKIKKILDLEGNESKKTKKFASGIHERRYLIKKKAFKKSQNSSSGKIKSEKNETDEEDDEDDDDEEEVEEEEEEEAGEEGKQNENYDGNEGKEEQVRKKNTVFIAKCKKIFDGQLPIEISNELGEN